MTNDELILFFNTGKWDRIEPIFKTLERFISYVKAVGKLDKIDLYNVYRESDDYVFINKLCVTLLNEFGVDYFLDLLVDVKKIGEEYFVKIEKLIELSNLFDDSSYRSMSSREIAERILEEDWFEAFSDTIYNYYDDIVEELNEKNLNELKEIILRDLKNQNMDSDEFGGIFFSENSNEEGYVTINYNNINYVLSDHKVFNELLNSGYLDELRGNLRSLHNMAYNEAWNDEVFEDIKSELSSYISTDFKWEQDNNKKYFMLCKIKHLKNDLYEYFNCVENYGYCIFDERYYIDMLTRYFDHCGNFLSFSTPEYPDSYKVRKYLNDTFLDYVY